MEQNTGRPAKKERNIQIMNFRRQGWTYRKIAEYFNVGPRVVWEICHQQRKYLKDDENFANLTNLPTRRSPSLPNVKNLVEKLSSNKLSSRERKIISLRFGVKDNIPRTLHEVGKVFGVTRERIRQIEESVLKKLAE